MDEFIPADRVESNSLRGSTRGRTALFPSHSLLYALCWNAGIYGPGLQIPCGHRPQSQYCSLADVHSRRNRSARAHPGVGAETHGKRNERERGVVLVVGGSENISCWETMACDPMVTREGL